MVGWTRRGALPVGVWRAWLRGRGCLQVKEPRWYLCACSAVYCIPSFLRGHVHVGGVSNYSTLQLESGWPRDADARAWPERAQAGARPGKGKEFGGAVAKAAVRTITVAVRDCEKGEGGRAHLFVRFDLPVSCRYLMKFEGLHQLLSKN